MFVAGLAPLDDGARDPVGALLHRELDVVGDLLLPQRAALEGDPVLAQHPLHVHAVPRDQGATWPRGGEQ